MAQQPQVEPLEEQLRELNESASQIPGIQDLLSLYRYYQRIERVASTATAVPRSTSAVSNGSYPAFPR